jgi:uncharacterized protein (DUF1778 family)
MTEAPDAEARQVPSEPTIFIADPAGWTLFNEALDRPAMDKPRLRALLTGPSVFDEE